MIRARYAASVPRDRIAEILEGAAERLDLCPWGQGNDRHGMQQICGEDAIYMAATGKYNLSDAIDYVLAENARGAEVTCTVSGQQLATSDHLKTNYLGQSLWTWNDDPDRTKDEVVDLFRTAAKDIRNAG